MQASESADNQGFLLEILKGLVPGEECQQLDMGNLDWPNLVQIAKNTRTEFLLLRGLEARGLGAPEAILSDLRQLKQRLLHRNMAHVASTVRMSRILQTHGIETLSVKGVLRAHEVYGQWDIRFASDMDLLVRHTDYRHAGEVLMNGGYDILVPTTCDWWHHYLGEAPFQPRTATGPTIDLHHKLDQPGTPALENAEFLFASAVARPFGGHNVKVLEPFAALMLAATGVGKALRQHEPCLAYLHEIAYARACDAALSDDALDAYAKEHNVWRLWRHARDAADGMFRPSTGRGAPSDIEGVMQDLAVHSWPQRMLHRTRLLWRWTDGEALRAFRFAREFARVRASMLSHASYEKQSQAS